MTKFIEAKFCDNITFEAIYLKFDVYSVVEPSYEPQ